MSETAQIVLVSVITVLTIVLALVGLQLVFILRSIRSTINKFNGVIDDARNITSKLSHSTDSVSGALVGLKAVLSLISAVQHKKGADDD